MSTIDYGCPECGHDGPHPVFEEEGGQVTAECVECHAEFDVDGIGEEETLL